MIEGAWLPSWLRCLRLPDSMGLQGDRRSQHVAKRCFQARPDQAQYNYCAVRHINAPPWGQGVVGFVHPPTQWQPPETAEAVCLA